MAVRKQRVGIVGKRAEAFAPAIASSESAELSAVCEADPGALRALGEHYSDARRFAEFDDMLDSVDAVVIATPMHLHASQSIAALSAGKAVLCEVTAAVTLDECWRLRDAATAPGRIYMMAENYCYGRDVSLVREMVRKGLFGEPYYGEGAYLHEVRTMHHTAAGEPTWRYYWQVGLRGNTYPTHSIGPVMEWFTAADASERIECVICAGSGVHSDPEHPHDDTTTTLCRLSSGKLIDIRLDMMSCRPHNPAYYALQGTGGVYEASRIGGRGHIWIGRNQPGEDRQWLPAEQFDEHLPPEWKNMTATQRGSGHDGGDALVVQDFLRCIETGELPSIDIFSALEWTAAGLCSKESIRSGSAAIRVPNFRELSERPLTLDGPRP